MRPPFSRHLADLLRENALRSPERTAVLSRGEAMTYSELDRRVDVLAGAFHGLGVGAGTTVGLLATNRWEWLCVAFAAHRLGAVVAAFNTFAKSWDLEYMLSHSHTEVLVAVDKFRSRDYVATIRELVPEIDRLGARPERFGALREIVLVGDEPAPDGARRFDDLAGGGAEPWHGSDASSAVDDAFVLYTSGSSARPKAVPLQHYAVIENGFHIGERMGLTGEDRVLVPAPLFWSYGASNALPATLTHGATMVLQEAFDPGEALELVERHRCTAAYTLPNITNALLRDPSFARERTASLRTGLTLGSPEDVRRTAEDLAIPSVCNIYGSTETYGNCCVTPADWPLERRAESQGPPLPGVELRIADQGSGAALDLGTVGEIRVRGHLARCYLGDEPSTSAAFGADGWYRSGDLGWLDEHGALHFAARATEMIKTGGINVAPSEVEELLAMHDAVGEVAVIGAHDDDLGEVVVAIVVAAADAEPAADELRAFCRDRMAGYKVPALLHVVDELPKTDTGKLSRRTLVERYGERSEQA